MASASRPPSLRPAWFSAPAIGAAQFQEGLQDRPVPSFAGTLVGDLGLSRKSKRAETLRIRPFCLDRVAQSLSRLKIDRDELAHPPFGHGHAEQPAHARHGEGMMGDDEEAR